MRRAVRWKTGSRIHLDMRPSGGKNVEVKRVGAEVGEEGSGSGQSVARQGLN